MSRKSRHHAVEAWLEAHDPNLHRAIHTPEAIDNFTELNAATANIAPSNAVITGPGAKAAKSNSDWETNPALGAVNCAQMARVAANYNPTDLSNAGATSAQYNDFLARLVKCPLYEVKLADSMNVTRTSSDWNTLIDDIANVFKGIAAEDKDTIISGLKTLAQAASSKLETTQKGATFVQNAVNVDGVITLYVYSSQTSFYEKKTKGFDMKQNAFQVNRLNLEFQKDLWPDWWQAVKARFDGNMNDWLNDNSSSTKGTKPIPALQ